MLSGLGEIDTANRSLDIARKFVASTKASHEAAQELLEIAKKRVSATQAEAADAKEQEMEAELYVQSVEEKWEVIKLDDHDEEDQKAMELDDHDELKMGKSVKIVNHLVQLREWLKEVGLDGHFDLLYSSSRDGFSDAAFHAKCVNQGATLTIVETVDGPVIGGYTSASMKSPERGQWESTNKAFLFALSGASHAGPIKVKLKRQDDGRAIYHRQSYGQGFGRGHDLRVESDMAVFGRGWDLWVDSDMTKDPGYTYEHNASWPLQEGVVYEIKEVELFQVSGV